MISPEHLDEPKSENEHVSSPTEEKQALPVSEKKRPWLNSLMRVVGVVLALGGSCASVLILNNLSFDFLDLLDLAKPATWLFLLVILVYAAFCAVLYRSMWATLIIPIALTLGALLAVFLATVPEGTWDFFAIFGVMFIITLPALLGAIIGGVIGVAWKERWWW